MLDVSEGVPLCCERRGRQRAMVRVLSSTTIGLLRATNGHIPGAGSILILPRSVIQLGLTIESGPLWQRRRRLSANFAMSDQLSRCGVRRDQSTSGLKHSYSRYG